MSRNKNLKNCSKNLQIYKQIHSTECNSYLQGEALTVVNKNCDFIDKLVIVGNLDNILIK